VERSRILSVILVTTPELTARREVAVKREDIGKAVLALREALKQAGRKRGWAEPAEVPRPSTSSGSGASADSAGGTSASSAGDSVLPFPEPVEGNGADVSELKKTAQQLHDWLIKPIAEDLRRADAQVLMVYLFGEMRYLPLAALHDGAHWLAEDYALVVYAAAADKGMEIPPRRAEWKVAGLGVSEAHQGFAPLPAVRAELDGIVRRGADDKDGALPGEMYLDAAFTQTRLRDVLDRNFPVLHIASHFNLNIGKDTDSFLLLGDGSHLSLADIGEQRYEWGSLDLLALSACNTGMGLGHADADGTEVEGMGVLVMKQGARSVLATLWQVSDQSTADFMQRLYASQAAGPLSKAKAIQQIQRAFIQAEKSGLPGYYAHPFHWAPFILMGNWL
jgi:CHAT domain-containing protein